MTDEINKLCDNKKIILQLLKDDGTFQIEYLKSINEIQRKHNIPYSTLINIYYICGNKGGGAHKKDSKKYIHPKYMDLLKLIRIFDHMKDQNLYNKDFYNKLIKN